jgi:membrane protease YdiL (CAAX protease family)
MTRPEYPFFEPEDEPESQPRSRENEAIPVWVPFVALFAVLMIVGIIGIAVYGLLEVTDTSLKSQEDLPDAATLALVFVQDLVFVFGAWIAVKLTLGRVPREQLGLRRVNGVFNAIKWAVVAYAFFWLATALLTAIFGQPEDQSLVTDIKAENNTAVLVVWAVLICVLAPVVEEIFFRGFMFTAFSRTLGVAWGAVLSSAVFGLGHAPAAPIQLIALGVFGVGLCLLYWRTGSIIPGMALHALNNSVTFGVTRDLDPALFAGVVVLSVGVVIAGGTAISTRSTVTA